MSFLFWEGATIGTDQRAGIVRVTIAGPLACADRQ
jgi:hypothetical protein